MNYPTPEENPVCECKGNPMAAFFCSTGHMLECHFPYSCSTAACSHLHGYDFSPEEIEDLEKKTSDAIKKGTLIPYEFDEQGNIRVNDVWQQPRDPDHE